MSRPYRRRRVADERGPAVVWLGNGKSLGEPNNRGEPGASTALTASGLAALRRAAVMGHTVGGIRLRLSTGAGAIVEGQPRPPPRWPCQRRRVTDPCGFRMAVARAWAAFESGQEIGLIGLAPGDELDLDWS